jgi:hypothetical protein
MFAIRTDTANDRRQVDNDILPMDDRLAILPLHKIKLRSARCENILLSCPVRDERLYDPFSQEPCTARYKYFLIF